MTERPGDPDAADTAADTPADTADGAGAEPTADPAAPDTTQSDPAPAPARRTAGAAASRARRIGGAVPSRRDGEDAPDSGVGSAGRPGTTVSTTKRDTGAAGASRTGLTETRARERARARTLEKTRDQARERDKTRDSRPLPRWVALVPAAVFSAVAIAFLALFVATRIGHDSGPSTTSGKQRQQVVAAAKTCVAATNTYRYTDVAKYEKAGIACATGTYQRQYRTAVDTLIKKNAPSQQFTQIAQVNVAGLESVTKDAKQWGILVYGQLNITNKNTGKQGRVDPFALVATMQQAKGKWVIAKISLINQVTTGN